MDYSGEWIEANGRVYKRHVWHGQAVSFEPQSEYRGLTHAIYEFHRKRLEFGFSQMSREELELREKLLMHRAKLDAGATLAADQAECDTSMRNSSRKLVGL